MAKKKRGPIEKKKKAVTIELLKRGEGATLAAPYKMIDYLVERFFPELADATFAVAWNLAPPRESGDGQSVFYRVKRASDLDREFSVYDFVFIISHEIWNNRLTDDQLLALSHEMLCHCAVTKDKNGEIKLDEKNRPVFRLRKPDVQTFRENVANFGQWRPEVEDLVESAESFNDKQRPLISEMNEATAKRGQKFSEPAVSPATAADTIGNGEAPANRGRRPKVEA